MRFKFLAAFYFGLDAILIAICSYFGSICVLNSQIAMICAILILFSSFYGYKKQIRKKSEIIGSQVDFSSNLKSEILDEFDEDLDVNSQENLSVNSDVNSKEKIEKIKFSSYEIFSAFSPLRIISYLTLIIAFFVLRNKELFEPFSFLAGLGIMPLGTLIAGFFSNEQ